MPFTPARRRNAPGAPGLLVLPSRSRDNRHMDAPIVGREEELSRIAAFTGAGEPWPRSLLLEGEAGSGKTTLWQAAVDGAESLLRVLATRPLEAEAKLAFSGVGDLLAGAHDVIAELPTPQAHALRAALMLEAPVSGAVDDRGVALGFLGALHALAREERVLVAIDDVQWLDRPSSRALAFAARRLDSVRVAFVLALRSESRPLLGYAPEQIFPLCTKLPVEPLTLEQVHDLIKRRLGLALARPTLRTVYETSRGNPLFALELARALPARGVGQTVGEPLRVPPTLRELVGARVTALPGETRAALAAAAALAEPTLELIGAATERDAAAALGPAVEDDVVALAAGRVHFTHPLLASAAYGTAEPTRRREIHARLAVLVPEAEERARHLAQAASGPDAAVAAALDEAAALARARGAPSAAAELLEEARALTPPSAHAAACRRAVEAAGHHVEAGDARRARALLDEAIPALPAGADRARALITFARVRSYDDDVRAAVELLEEAIAEASSEPLVQGRAHEILSGILFRLRERFADAVEHARAAPAIARSHDDLDLLAGAVGSQVLAEAARGDEEAAGTLVAATALPSAERFRGHGGAEFQVAVVQMWWEELEAAGESFERILRLAGTLGDESSVPYVHVLLAQTECLRGRYDVAAAHADEGALRAEQVGQATLVAYALALRALTAADRGEEDLTRETARRALELAGRTSGRPAEQFATAALGLLEVSLGRDAEAVDVLSPLVAFAREQEMREPGLTRFVPDLVEALVGVGRPEPAADHLDWYEANAERLQRPSGLGAAARCRGLMAAAGGDLTGALEAFDRALVHHDASPISFDRARTLLAPGAARRRGMQRRAARVALEEARTVFVSLGARVWDQRAEAELARIGGRAPSTGELTPVERRVAELVAAGRTNREVAGGVHSRVELARKLG